MTDKKELTIPSQGSIIRDFIMRVKLIWRLMKDARVSTWLKVIPVLGVVYFIVPLDFDYVLPVVGQLDDAAVLWLTNYVFVELCPPDVVAHHVKALTAGMPKSETDDVVDADSVEFRDQGRRP